MYIVNHIKSHYRKLCRAIAFGKKAYSGYDWDYSYSIDIFKFSLERLAKNLEEKGTHESSSDSAQRINMICKLMDKVQNGDYEYEYHTEMEKTYGKSKMTFKDIGDGSHEYTGQVWEKAVDETHNTEINSIEAKRLCIGYKKQERADILVWKLIQHNIRNWWH